MGGGGGAYTGGIRGENELETQAKERLSQLGNEKTYNVFIPHAWDYDDDYKKLIGLLKDVEDFDFKDYSVPKEDPIDANTKNSLEKALRQQIALSTIVIVPAGMYVNHREWIQREIEIAKEFPNKPIIAVAPRGSERIPEYVRQNADAVVGWNKDSIVDAIKRLIANNK